MEILVALAIALAAVVAGYTVSDAKSRRKLEEDLGHKMKLLNENLEAFTKAYAQFNDRILDVDTRLTSLEFRVNARVDASPLTGRNSP